MSAAWTDPASAAASTDSRSYVEHEIIILNVCEGEKERGKSEKESGNEGLRDWRRAREMQEAVEREWGVGQQHGACANAAEHKIIVLPLSLPTTRNHHHHYPTSTTRSSPTEPHHHPHHSQ